MAFVFALKIEERTTFFAAILSLSVRVCVLREKTFIYKKIFTNNFKTLRRWLAAPVSSFALPSRRMSACTVLQIPKSTPRFLCS